MNRQSGPSGISTTFATISGCPHSTAASTANATAVSSNGTSSVASMTGRVPAGADGTREREPGRRSVSMRSLRVELPPRRAAGGGPCPAPPHRQVEEEPRGRHDRGEEDEALVHDGDQRHEDRGEQRRQAEGLEPETLHRPEQPVVLLGRDLPGVPGAAAALAAPPLAVGELAPLAALALHRDRRLAHLARL